MGTIVTIATTSGVVGWWAVALALAVAALSARGFVRLRGTTLAAPAAWAVVVALVLAAVEATLAWRGDLEGTFGASLARYAAAVGTFCPLTAVLGAKRPQDRGWQWIVLSLWIVLLVPMGQAWAARTGKFESIGAAWRLMLGGLTVLGLLNYLPTRQFWAALLAAIGQHGLLFAFLFSRDPHANSVNRLAGLGICLLAALIVRRPQSATRTPVASQLTSFDRRWVTFRDCWGAFWGLRILNRINESAELSGWPVRLKWGGFVPTEGQGPPEVDERVAAQIEQAMGSLLRRFERLDGSTPRI